MERRKGQIRSPSSSINQNSSSPPNPLRHNLSYQSLDKYRLSPTQSIDRANNSKAKINSNILRSRSFTRSPSIPSIDPRDSSNPNPIDHQFDTNAVTPIFEGSVNNTSSNDRNTIRTSTTSMYHAQSDKAIATYTNNQQGPRSKILNLPQRLFSWLYSFSLVALIILILAFVAVTPIDVIIQTLKATNGTNAVAVKTFVVIAVCVVFLLISIIIYLVRVYNFRVSMNDVPQKSLYIPFENDYPKVVFKYIESKLKNSIEISEKAGPLNQPYSINHPGLSPPEYIQRRNPDLDGTLLPPNINYEDILQSFGDKFRVGKILTDEDLPISLSIKEILLLLYKQIIDSKKTQIRVKPNVTKLISIYEKCRFGPNLILEKDLLQLMLEFDKFGQLCQNDYQSQIPKNRRISRLSQSSNYEFTEGNLSSSDMKYYSSAMYYDHDDTNEDEEYKDNQDLDEDTYSESFDEKNELSKTATFGHRKVEPQYYTNFDPSINDDTNSRRLVRHQSYSSSRSVIRNKLALESKHTLSSLKYEGNDEDNNSLVRNKSGYVTDSENEFDPNELGIYESRRRYGEKDKREKKNDNDVDVDDDDEQFYNFRRYSSNFGQPITPEQSPER
ncbi:DLT1 [Candida pseudojiufengensis]|uniref:DLT1 n=1 Tax=Candida pseudojiufengensis TaxID=497109 RepID=UPI002225A146|nr:DLT1 [Candida pseudojiufengensis]KAI5960331.1 DLT1 [Candida pseudojiufengensis]